METVVLVNMILLWLVVLFNLFLTFALVRRSSPTASRTPRGAAIPPGTEAPEFSAETLSGEIKTLASYRSHKVALIFISTHCQPCHDLLLNLRQMEAAICQSAVELILVSLDERTETGALVDELDIHFQVLLAPRNQNTFFIDYKVAGTPFYYFINSQGKVHASGYPVMQAGEWKALTQDWDTDKTYALSKMS